jgi:hypothetical protein
MLIRKRFFFFQARAGHDLWEGCLKSAKLCELFGVREMDFSIICRNISTCSATRAELTDAIGQWPRNFNFDAIQPQGNRPWHDLQP